MKCRNRFLVADCYISDVSPPVTSQTGSGASSVVNVSYIDPTIEHALILYRT
jgi:hypothetical protein